MTTNRLIRLKTVLDRIPVSRSTIYEWMGQGKFPAPVNLSGGIVAWRESEVDAWIAGRPQNSTDDGPGVGVGVAEKQAA